MVLIISGADVVDQVGVTQVLPFTQRRTHVRRGDAAAVRPKSIPVQVELPAERDLPRSLGGQTGRVPSPFVRLGHRFDKALEKQLARLKLSVGSGGVRRQKIRTPANSDVKWS